MKPKILLILGLVTGAIGVIIKMITGNPRDKIIRIAKTQLGVQDPDKYWAVVQPGLVNSKAAWCGGFALWAIKEAGFAKDTIWQIGKGFTEINRLPRTKNPEPGDIAYYDQPFQHHAIVSSVKDGIVNTIDGNQPGGTVQEKQRPLNTATAYYSITPLIENT